jgi:glycosyltransferase involved in cell wall biosynthesis
LQDQTRDLSGGDVILSAIIPHHNHGRYIGRAVNALLTQECAPDEIIIVDDASTDDSLAIINELAAKSPRIVVINQPVNAGTNAALRAGFARARGQYFVLAGADDWVMPGFCKFGMEMLTQNPNAGLFCGDTVIVDGETEATTGYRPAARPLYRAGIISPRQCEELLKRMDNFIHTGGAIFRRDAILKAGGFDESLGAFADGYLTRKIALTFGFCYVPRVVACWRVFITGVSRSTALDLTKAKEALELYPARLAADHAFPAWYPGVFRKRWQFATSRLALQATPPDFDFVVSMAATTAIDRLVFNTIRAIRKNNISRGAALGWLWLRLRPYRLTDLVATWLARQFDQFSAQI